MRKVKNKILLFLKGVAMGVADLIPGVSGGTIAFITGIYEELLNSINAIDISAIQLLLNFKFREFWKKINGNFLLVLFSGILISLFSLAKLVSNLMINEPISLWSFFFGLILISAVLVLKKIRHWNLGTILALILGGVIAYFITTFSPVETSNSLLFIFFCGMLAICAMILPGISGSFILLILGKYEYVINLVKDFKIGVLIIFALGCVTGLLSFSRLISWVLTKFHNTTIAVLSGFMLGSVNKIWPWKKVIEYRIDRHGDQVPLVDQSILPNQYFEITGNDPQLLNAMIFTILAIILVLGFERLGSRISPSKS